MPSIHTLSLVHLVFLSLWGGVVATEAVIEILPRLRREHHGTTVLFHFWIDLLVEAPLLFGVVVTGVLTLAKSGRLAPSTS